MCGNAVMYEAGKIFTVGGATNYDDTPALTQAHVITLGDTNANVQVQQVSPIYGRMFGNSVVLPNGEVFTNGGQAYSNIFTDYQAFFYPEMFDPTTQSIRVLEAPAAIARTYHTVSVLLPDATVFTGGGGLCGANCQFNHANAEIYQPPYLFKGNALATRPAIKSVSTTSFVAGTQFTVTVNLTYSKAATFSIVRAGSSTHSTNTDQRRISLTPVSTAGNKYTLRLPSDYGVLLPGWYYLFAMDGDIPSVATWIQVRMSS